MAQRYDVRFAYYKDSDNRQLLRYIGDAAQYGNRDCMDRGYMEGSVVLSVSAAQKKRLEELENARIGDPLDSIPYEVHEVDHGVRIFQF